MVPLAVSGFETTSEILKQQLEDFYGKHIYKSNDSREVINANRSSERYNESSIQLPMIFDKMMSVMPAPTISIFEY